MERIAVIGAGPGGLVAARFLKSEGFEPVLFEQGSSIGGQWSGDRNHSGVWPSLRTNTSRVLTAFSDLPHEPGLAVYPSNQEIGAYLRRYADQFDLTSRTRRQSPVQEIRRSANGWTVQCADKSEDFEKAVVASGRFHFPWTPAVAGLESFSGSEGVAHTYHYEHPEQYRGKRVLVAGCAVSTLEIASDLAMLGAARVVVSNRRQRYVLPKLAAGVPSDHRAFTRYGALAEESLSRDEVGGMLKELVLEAGGSPEQYGAPKPADSIFEAGLTLCQHYLPLVAEGRIEVRPWLEQVVGTSVRFTDGRTEEFDAILFGTGFEIRLPFLSEEIRRTLDVDAQHIDLYRHTFHPRLPGLAFLGMWDQSGPYFPPLELQARWLAYSWSGAVPPSSINEMEEGISAYRSRRGQSQKTRMNLVTIAFARAAGVEPDISRWPHLTRALLFGPLAPVSFRLNGHDALPDAAKRFEEEAQSFGCVTSNALSVREADQLQSLARASGDSQLAALASAATTT